MSLGQKLFSVRDPSLLEGQSVSHALQGIDTTYFRERELLFLGGDYVESGKLPYSNERTGWVSGAVLA